MGAVDADSLSKEIEILEKQIHEGKKKLAGLRKQLPPEPINDYEFTAPDGKKVTLSEMFGKRDELLLIHNMGKGCRYCTLWADGLNGVRHHLADRAALALVSPDDYETQRQFAQSRGWEFPIFSHKGSSFSRDVGFADEKDMQWPGFSTFRKNPDGRIERIARAFFGPGDDFCAVWHLFDLLPEGVNKWEPQYDYK